MTTNTNDVILVEYSHIDGAHYFTGKDAYAIGLCVADADLKTAFDEVSIQLMNLLEVNHEIKATVEPGVSFEEFQKWVTESQTPKATKIKPTKTVADLPYELKKAA